MKKSVLILIGALAVGLAAASSSWSGSIIESKHNLSITGPGNIKSTSEDQVCIFCHTPHHSSNTVGFLWNRQEVTTVYTPYQSSTLFASVGQPTGASKLCLSCHDGTIALGSVLSESQEIPFSGGIRFMPPSSPALLGTDLSDDHPVSFVYDSQLAQSHGELVDPALLPPDVKLDKNGQLQCTACHDPHDDEFDFFLVTPNPFSDLCLACHQPDGWPQSSHATSNATWNGQGADPFPRSDALTVAENGCANCHRAHSAGGTERLLNQQFEEDNCIICHNGNVAATDIEAVITKPSRHPVQDFTLVHDPTEDFSLGGVPRHVECQDCHNGHQVNAQPSPGAPVVSGANAGVTGITLNGQQVENAQNTYEICFKCHADDNVINTLPITRVLPNLNTRTEFNPGNPSYHPVAAPGVNPDVPSLISPLTTSSIITCSDCHSNDDLSGPRGPHGSNNSFMLERAYDTNDFANESASTYALCYKCHSCASILSDQSFSEHSDHIVDENSPCSACHDPHGISATQGTMANNTHLINFDLSIVQGIGGNPPTFTDQGRFAGSCTLVCHGEDHNPESYP